MTDDFDRTPVKLLHRTPLFVGLLVVLAAGGAVAGATLGHREPPDITRSALDPQCTLNGLSKGMLDLLPHSGYLATSRQQYSDYTVPAGKNGRTTCEVSTRTAGVVVSAYPLGTRPPAQWERGFADAHHVSLHDALHVKAGERALAWPTAGIAHVTCPGPARTVYGIEIRLSGDAGRDVSSPQSAVAHLTAESIATLTDLPGCAAR